MHKVVKLVGGMLSIGHTPSSFHTTRQHHGNYQNTKYVLAAQGKTSSCISNYVVSERHYNVGPLL